MTCRTLRSAAAVLCIAAASWAADWPAYRGDAARSGYSAESLSADLALRWTYKPRHAPQPAWSGRDTRMPFDLAHHVVVVDGLVVFASSADGTLRGLEAGTGAQRWVFRANGPIRFAPAGWRDRLFAVSDDGRLYCLSAGDGRVLWQRRGGPADSMVLLNERMVSRWPARGGPAVADDTVYFAAGIWPSEGIFLYALDAETGEVRWCNDTAGSRRMPQPHGGAVAKSGVSAQGYLVVAGDRLIVPTGRGVPAVFDRATGKFLYFHLQRYGHYGGADVVAVGEHFLNAGALFELTSGALAHRGIPTRAAAVTPTHFVYAHGKDIAAVERAAMWTRRETTGRKGKKKVTRAFAGPSWRAACPHGTTRTLIVAGDTVVAGGADGVSLIDRASKRCRLTVEVDGVPWGLAAADGRLFVSTDKGTIHCFGTPTGGGPATIEPRRRQPPPAGEAFDAAADAILLSAEVRDGWCVDLGCGDGALACALARRSRLRIVAIDQDPEKVRLARQRLDAAGLLQTQVTVHQGDPAGTPYPNWFANLVVSGRSVVEGPEAVPAEEARRLQRPCGGVLCIGRPGEMRQSVRAPLEGAGQWTHQYADPANTACSGDALARGPLGLAWCTDFGFQMPNRHGRGPAPLCWDGRLFIEGVHGLLAVDAYNGRKLWHCDLPRILDAYDQEHLMGVSGTGSNLCAGPDALYVHRGSECLVLDPATGKRLATLNAPSRPDGKPGRWGYMACVGDTLIGSLANTAHTVRYRYGRSDMSTQYTESLLLFALDAETGKLKWQFAPQHSIRHNAIAVGKGRVYLIDRPLALADRASPPKAKKAREHPPGVLVALDAADGSVAWRKDRDIFGTLLALSGKHDALLMSYQHTRFRLPSEVGGRMAAFRASTGERLWDSEAGYGSRPVVNGRTVYAQPGAWDLLTGERLDFKLTRSYGCGILSGSRHLLLFRSATLGYRDLTGDYGTENYGGLRPGCWINAIAAGGLVLVPDATDRCGCSYLIKASIALQPYGLRPPTIRPAGGGSREALDVTLAHDRDQAQIRYTLDGSSPTSASALYDGPLRLAKSAVVRARAFARGVPPSEVAEASFLVDPDMIRIDGPHWKVLDSAGAKPPQSQWEVRDETVIELSNHYTDAAGDADYRTDRPGTYRVFTGGKPSADGELALELASSDNDGLGVAFRFQGQNQHYLWAMDAQRRFHILACKKGESYRVLAHKPVGYTRNHWYRVRVVLDGAALTVYLDGAKDLEARDETFAQGTFALYAWGCAGAKFRNVRWK
ncbi:MAG: PQQ-binding-like beta-propeller repeat protein [Planctomycetota bacterium]